MNSRDKRNEPMVDGGDIQGVIPWGHGSLVESRFVLFGIDDPENSGSWLAELVERVPSATDRPTESCVHVSFTRAGLEKLGLPDDVVGRFSREFLEGVATPHRQRCFGDVGESAPEKWGWGSPGGETIHGMLALYASDSNTLGRAYEEEMVRLEDSGLRSLHTLDTSSENGNREHFGFRDGVARVFIEGIGHRGSAHDTVKPGEVLLGYRNEFDQFPPSPTVASAHDPRNFLPADSRYPDRRDLGKNGSYLVFRQLEQDVYAFWKFLDEQTGEPDGNPRPETRTWLAAKMVGRWPDGAPLATNPSRVGPSGRCIESDVHNAFGYGDDPLGTKTPIASHIRRTNPRDTIVENAQQSRRISRTHRIVRRGRVYGPPLSSTFDVDEILGRGPDGVSRGLHFLCFNAALGRQFEFIQQTWIHNPKFGGLYSDSDPIMGIPPAEGGAFTVPANPVRRRVTGLPRFVQVRGAGYFFMPGKRALRYLAFVAAKRPS